VDGEPALAEELEGPGAFAGALSERQPDQPGAQKSADVIFIAKGVPGVSRPGEADLAVEEGSKRESAGAEKPGGQLAAVRAKEPASIAQRGARKGLARASGGRRANVTALAVQGRVKDVVIGKS
jgi:hypothetical protein